MVSLIDYFQISKSTFYDKIKTPRNKERDVRSVDIIDQLCEKRKYAIGVRQIKLELEYHQSIVMNKKKIGRIKKKYDIPTLIRKKSKYRKIAIDQKEHAAFKNILNREFDVETPDTVYCTDVTEISYGGGKAYLAAFKDLCTKDIVSSEVSFRNDLKLTNKALKSALCELNPEKYDKLLIHSDQGFNFTHYTYRQILKNSGVTQSMSRRGNCLDNAPIESFFGYLKDHISPKKCNTLDELRIEIDREINYYNEQRPQKSLKKMPPAIYRKHYF
jgi:putative transposase